jgi:photosystem II stability/assembly factor-like uncharacterized protein
MVWSSEILAQDIATLKAPLDKKAYQRIQDRRIEDFGARLNQQHQSSPLKMNTKVGTTRNSNSVSSGSFWQQSNGPYGGYIETVASTSDGETFATSLGVGMFRSSDNGTTWTQINSGLGDINTQAIAINSSNSIFVGTPSGIYRSDNYGDSWNLVSTGYTMDVTALAIDGNGFVYAGTYDTGIYVSYDGGSTWYQSSTTTYYISSFTCVSSTYTTSLYGDIFAATWGGGVIKSADGGITWISMNSGLTVLDIQSLVTGSSGYIYAGTYLGGAFRSTNGGSSWTAMNSGLTSTDIQCLIVKSNGYMYAGSSDQGMFRSTNSGSTWVQINTNLTATDIRSLHSNISGYVFAGTSGNGMFRITDGITSWTAINQGLTVYVRSLAVNTNGDIYAGTYYCGVYRSTDNGNNWIQLTNSPNFTFYSLVFNTSGYIFGATSSGVYRSTDNGSTWTQTNVGLTNTYALALAVNKTSGYLYVGGEGGVYSSSNNGNSWSNISVGLNDTLVRALAINSLGYLFAGTYSGSGGIFRSTNGGAGWTQINSGLTSMIIRSFAFNSSNTVFAGTAGSGIFRSTNNGSNWTAINIGLSDMYVNSMVFDNSGYLYAGTPDYGVAQSTNNGDSWADFNDGLSNLYVIPLTVNSTGTLFAGTGGSGVFLGGGSTAESPLRLAPFFISGKYLNDQIAADTLANGKLPNRVYVLQRGGIYRANSDFTNTNWTLRIRANDSTTTQKPVIFLYPSPITGALPGQFINVSGNVELKNLIVSGYYEPADTNLRSLQGTLLRIPTTTSGWKIAIDSCILSNTDGQHIRTEGAASVIKVTNTAFANMGYLGRSNLGAGKAIDLRANAIDTVIVQNCTFVNSQDRIIRHLGSTAPFTSNPIKYLLFDHNTLINGMSYHGMLALGNVSERAIITNNLLLDPFSLGNDTDYTRQLEFVSSGEKDLYGGNRMTWIFSEPNQTAQWTISNNYYGISDSGLAFYNQFASAGVTGEGSPLTWHINSRLGADSANAIKKVYIVPQKAPALMTKLMRWYRSPSGGNKTKNTPTAWVFGNVNTHPYIDPYDFDRKGYEWLQDSLNCSYQASESPTSTDGKVVGDTRWKYGGIIGSNTAPAAPQNLTAIAGNGQVTLKWNKNKESDFLRYRIYRGTSPNPTTKVDSSTASILDTVKLITGLTNSTTYYFRITAMDNANLESGFSNEVNATPTAVVDNTPPTVSINTPTGTPVLVDANGLVSSSPQVSASASDGGSGISRMQVAYRNTSEQSWSFSQYVPATSISFSIPTNKFVYNNKPIGVNYRVGAWDNAGNVTWSPYNSIDVQLGPQVTDQSTNMPAASQLSNKTTAYRMISVPYDLTNKQPANLLSNFGDHKENNISYARWRFQRYVNGQYQDYDQFSQTNAVIPGAAFFFIVRDQGTQIVVQGASVVRSDNMYNTNISLKNGWNLIGNPFTIPYPVDSLEYLNTSRIGRAYYSGSGAVGGWEITGSNVAFIQPWQGIAIKVNSDGTLKFPSVGQRSGLPKLKSTPAGERSEPTQAENLSNWMIPINAYRSDIDMRCEGGSVGMVQGASEGDDQYDLYIPPFVGDKNIAVYFNNSEGAMLRDIRPLNEDGDVWEMRVVTGDAGAKVKLQWGDKLNLPNPAFEAYLIDTDQKIAHNLKEVQSLEINSGTGVRNFRVIVGKKSFVEGNNAGVALAPSSMKLYANYPNPFNPETVIRYTVPDASASYMVTLKIFNVLGQEIATLVSEQKSAGYYEVKWNALQQSSGIYFYQLSVTDGTKTFQDIKKMVLMK